MQVDLVGFSVVVVAQSNNPTILNPDFLLHNGIVSSSWVPHDLEEALEDLRAAPDEAMDEGYLPPTKLVLANAGRILRRMHTLLPTRFEVYPTPDGEVAIVAPGAPRHSVMVLCDSNGGALCTVNMDGEHRRARYSNASSLPDGFLRDALNELAHREG